MSTAGSFLIVSKFLVIVDVLLRHAVLGRNRERLVAMAADERGELHPLGGAEGREDLLQRQVTDADHGDPEPLAGRQRVGDRPAAFARIVQRRQRDLAVLHAAVERRRFALGRRGRLDEPGGGGAGRGREDLAARQIDHGSLRQLVMCQPTERTPRRSAARGHRRAIAAVTCDR